VSDTDDLTDLLEFLYQCPVGLIEMDQAGVAGRINPAAARMILPALVPGEDIRWLSPVLERLAPGLLADIRDAPARLGRLGPGHQVCVPGGASGSTWIELLVTRVEEGGTIIALVDVTAERKVAARGHEIALALQFSMLGRIDPINGLPFSVTYRAADAELQVGGDWYDVIDLPDGKVGLVVGDVVGHGLEATIAMGQLRSEIRGLASGCEDPGELLDRSDAVAARIDDAECTTLAYAILDRRGGQLLYSSAGHPPILVVRQGTAKYLTGSRGPPLACGWLPDHSTSRERLALDDIVVLYTDGLIESRTESLEIGLFDLRAAARSLPHLPSRDYSNRLATAALAGRRLDDDLCVLALTYLGPDRPFSAADQNITALAGHL
jgi:hypothetical protein